MISAAVKGALAPRSCGSPLTAALIMKQCTTGEASLATARLKNSTCCTSFVNPPADK